MAANMRLKNQFTEDEQCHTLMSWLLYLFGHYLDILSLCSTERGGASVPSLGNSSDSPGRTVGPHCNHNLGGVPRLQQEKVAQR